MKEVIQLKPRRGPKAKFFYRAMVRKAAIAKNLMSDLAIAEACGINHSIVSRFFQKGSCSQLTIDKIARVLELEVGKLRDRSREMKQAELWDRQPKLF